MQIILKIFFSVFLVFVFTSEAYSICYSQEESYEKYVNNTTISESFMENEKSIKLLIKHLECYPEKAVFLKLAKIYEYIGKYFLAELAYIKTGTKEESDRLEQERLKNINVFGNNINFQLVSESKAQVHFKSSKNRKILSRILFVLGSGSTAAGLGLFIHDKAGGTNSMFAQYSLILGGLSMLSGGLALNAQAERELKYSEAYKAIAGKYGGDTGTTPEEFYIYSGTQAKTRKSLAGTYRKHGGAMLIMSIPMLAFAIYGFVDSTKYRRDREDPEQSGHVPLENVPFILATIAQTLSFAPAIITFAGGLSMISKASKWETQSTEPSLFTLNSITPIINPVSKTYGLALGFSF